MLSEDGNSFFRESDLSSDEHNITIQLTNPSYEDTVCVEFTIYNDLPNYINYEHYEYIGRFDNSMYFKSQIETSWNGADSLCNNNQAHLVTITLEEENEYLLEKLSFLYPVSHYEFWIGLYYDTTSDSLRWVTNEIYDFSQLFDWYEPNDEIPFVYLELPYGDWHGAGYYSKRFIMEIEEN
jgi:hypothetical protein